MKKKTNNNYTVGKEKKADKSRPVIKPDKNVPVKPDKNPDPTKRNPEVNDPNREEPAKIDEPSKTDPVRIDDPPPGY